MNRKDLSDHQARIDETLTKATLCIERSARQASYDFEHCAMMRDGIARSRLLLARPVRVAFGVGVDAHPGSD